MNEQITESIKAFSLRIKRYSSATVLHLEVEPISGSETRKIHSVMAKQRFLGNDMITIDLV